MSEVESVASDPAWRPTLSLWDAMSLMVGIVVGTTVFVAPGMIFSNVPSAAAGLAIWGLAGVLSLIGGLVFAEMAVSLPRGGAYTYLSVAFGPAAGLVYGVAMLSIILTTTIGAMAFAFASYAMKVFPGAGSEAVWASGGVVVLALLNSWSIHHGRRTQNLLTLAKVLGLGAIIVTGLVSSPAESSVSLMTSAPQAGMDLGLAMVLALYAYGGWSDAASVAAEVRNRQRSIPWALAGGLAAVTVIYLIVNLAYLQSLGLQGVRGTETPAREVMLRAAGATAANGVSVLVMISALGAIHGMLFSGSRSMAALGRDHRMFAPLGRWNAERGVPVLAVWTLAAVSLLQIAFIGLAPWKEFQSGFETLVAASAPLFWLLMLAVGVAFFQLRRKGHSPREFACPGAPLVPLLFCVSCLFMLWRSIDYAKLLGLLGLAPCVIAGLLALFPKPDGDRPASAG